MYIFSSKKKKKTHNYGGSPTSFSAIQLRLISLLLRDLKQILYQHHAEQKKIQLTRQIRTNADVPLYQIILFRPFPFLLDDNKIAKQLKTVYLSYPFLGIDEKWSRKAVKSYFGNQWAQKDETKTAVLRKTPDFLRCPWLIPRTRTSPCINPIQPRGALCAPSPKSQHIFKTAWKLELLLCDFSFYVFYIKKSSVPSMRLHVCCHENNATFWFIFENSNRHCFSNIST